MNRFFTDRIQGNTAEIAGEDIRHIEKVLRLRAGDRIVVCDGAGTDYTAEISSICPSQKVSFDMIMDHFVVNEEE